MAEDAKVSKIDELTAYAGKMHGFMESVSGNCTALNNLMIQKLDSLRKKLKEAERIEAEAIADFIAALDDLAKTANNDVQGRNAKKARIPDLENKKLKAQRLRGIVSQQVNVALGATNSIIDGTKRLQSKLGDHVDKGTRMIKKSVAQLDQYNEMKKKV